MRFFFRGMDVVAVWTWFRVHRTSSTCGDSYCRCVPYTIYTFEYIIFKLDKRQWNMLLLFLDAFATTTAPIYVCVVICEYRHSDSCSLEMRCCAFVLLSLHQLLLSFDLFSFLVMSFSTICSFSFFTLSLSPSLSLFLACVLFSLLYR